MNQKDRMIIEDFRKRRADFVQLGDIVSKMINDLLKNGGINTLAVEHRVKEENSLAGKLERKGDYYSTLLDITDLLGARVICFFADEVDAVGKLIEDTFVIDREHSTDKRALIKADSFGYLSLHYICSLPEDKGYPSELYGIRFEIQVRTTLQHTWACIYHDMGYKSEFGVPRAIVRQFSRVAGLLEIADDEFVRARNSMHTYTEDIRQKIADDAADEVLIDMVSLKEYMIRNKKMRAFLQELANICGAEISEIDPDNYIEQLHWLGKTSLGDMEKLLTENHDLAMALAKQALTDSELDILSSNVGLRFLCRAQLLNKGYTPEEAAEFLCISVGDKARAERMAKSLFRSYARLEGITDER